VLAAVCRACVVSDGSTAMLRTVEGEREGERECVSSVSHERNVRLSVCLSNV